MQVVLASGSPARYGLLRHAGISPQVLIPDVDEETLSAQHPHMGVPDRVRLLAEAKHEAGVRLFMNTAKNTAKENRCPADTEEADAEAGAATGSTLLIAADTLVELDGQALGKPHTPEAAHTLWQAMSGKTVHVHTGHCLSHIRYTSAGLRQEDTNAHTITTAVHLTSPTATEIAAYIATGEPLGVAGGLTIDGIGSAFIDRIHGDYTNVIGLSIPFLRQTVREWSLAWPDLWDTSTT